MTPSDPEKRPTWSKPPHPLAAFGGVRMSVVRDSIRFEREMAEHLARVATEKGGNPS